MRVVPLPFPGRLARGFRARDLGKRVDGQGNQRFRLGDALPREVYRRFQDGLLVFGLEDIDKVVPSQLMLSSTTGNTVCATYPPATLPTRPASPSIILTATFVSSLYT